METKNRPVRVRFAPSPTGYLHIGSLRATLFNWLFARHHKGTFIVRIEDTDVERSKDIYTASILRDLQWMGLVSDEPIIYQTQRLHIYKEVIDTLLAEGKAYKDFYTQEEVEALHVARSGSHEFARAYNVCRGQQQDQDKPYVVRFKLPLEHEKICFDDIVRGTVCFDIEQLDDFVIARPDGMPMYNFVVVIDDIAQNISHVVRGEDHISNTPKQILLYEALGKTLPIFAHLPLILGKNGERLSKRDAATATQEYREAGYLPDALLNYLVRLGWSHGDQEIFSKEELISLFRLEDVGKKGSIFDQEKLNWVNATYIRQTDNKELYQMLLDLNFVIGQNCFTESQLCALIGLYKERVSTLFELAQALQSFSLHERSYDETACKEWIDTESLVMMKDLIDQLNTIELFTLEIVKQLIADHAKKYTKKLGAVAQPIRIALVGTCNSPSIFELLAILGKEESLARLKRFVDLVQPSS